MSTARPGLPGPLVDLLGATWTMGAPVVGVGWFGGQSVAGFGLGDGTVALARAGWDGAARLQNRPGGGVELVPASAPSPPVGRVGVHAGPCTALAATPEGFLLSGGGDGKLARLGPDGSLESLSRHAGETITALSAGQDGHYAFAVGSRLHRGAGADAATFPAAIAALSFQPSGGGLAVAHGDGVSLLAADSSAGEGSALVSGSGSRALAWSRDGRYLAAGTQQGSRCWRFPGADPVALPNGPAEPSALSFAGDGLSLAAAGGPRVACWSVDPPGGDPVECGIASSIPVTHVACHPVRAVIAAGYGNGAVLLVRPGAEGVLLVRGPGQGAVTALAWSQSGEALALGTAGGEIAVVAFPDLLFRPEPVARPSAKATAGVHA